LFEAEARVERELRERAVMEVRIENSDKSSALRELEDRLRETTSSKNSLSEKLAKAETELRLKDELEAKLLIVEQSLRDSRQNTSEDGNGDDRITGFQVALTEEIERRAQLQRTCDALEIGKRVLEDELREVETSKQHLQDKLFEAEASGCSLLDFVMFQRRKTSSLRNL